MYDLKKSTGRRSDCIDLRSDTVTKPTQAMREIMAAAPVGDDVYGDDPTVEALEKKVADLLGKEAAMFVASGTQSNLIALMSHCGRGEEYISGSNYHVAHYEAGGAAVLGGISPLHLPVGPRHQLSVEAVQNAIKADDFHHAVTKLVSLENTVYGLVHDQECLSDIANMAHDNNLMVHLDGARLMNAVVKSNRKASDLVVDMDSVSLCLSKGLGAPVGSVLSGTADFIKKGRRLRKMLGGGMRQAGILAACGLYALENHVDRLSEDHNHAEDLAKHLSQYEALGVDLGRVETNMVFLTPNEDHALPFRQHLMENDILISGKAPTMRLVTHLNVSANAIDRICTVVDQYFAGKPS